MLNAVGFVVILVCVFGSFIISGGSMEVILHALPHEMMAIAGAAIGAFIVSNSMGTVKLAGKGIMRSFKGARYKAETYRELLTLLFNLLNTFKKSGATGIEPHLDNPHESSIFSRYPAIVHDHHLTEFICDYVLALARSRRGVPPGTPPR
ncbi:motility-associated protein [Sphingomonas ginkgonis]|uniref:motility-associated protein n=1 Tax=Sphingomonas ginkgonis TaxID=2315330 RepID=UPI00163B533E